MPLMGGGWCWQPVPGLPTERVQPCFQGRALVKPHKQEPGHAQLREPRQGVLIQTSDEEAGADSFGLDSAVLMRRLVLAMLFSTGGPC